MIEFKSTEETYFSYYLEELQAAGYIKEWSYEPETFELFSGFKHQYVKQLKTKKKVVEQSILKNHVYTPDFYVIWTEKAKGVWYDPLLNNSSKIASPFVSSQFVSYNGATYDASYIEVKPSFDQNNMTRAFMINQKWLFYKLQIYCQLVKPFANGSDQGLFWETFTPDKVIMDFVYKKTTKRWTAGASRLKYKPNTMCDYLNI